MVENLTSEKQQNLERICERHGVSSRAVFGSAAGEDFDPESSDVDFVVEFEPMAPIEHKNAYFGMISDLETLFQCSVDLVEPGTLENPYIRESIKAHQKTIYVAA